MSHDDEYGWFPFGDDEPHVEFLRALREAPWPAALQSDYSGAYLDDYYDQTLISVEIDAMSIDTEHHVGDIRADYNGRELWLGWENVGCGSLRSHGYSPVGEFTPEAAAARAFEYFIEQARREVAILTWLCDDGEVWYRFCLHTDDGQGHWSSHRPDAPRDRPPDTIVRFRPLP